MKVMISIPMAGKSEQTIIDEMKQISDKFEKLHIDVVDTNFTDNAPENVNPGVYYLAKSIDAMSTVDAVYFAEGWQTARGCRVERLIAEEYGIKILETEFLNEK